MNYLGRKKTTELQLLKRENQLLRSDLKFYKRVALIFIVFAILQQYFNSFL